MVSLKQDYVYAQGQWRSCAMEELCRRHITQCGCGEPMWQQNCFHRSHDVVSVSTFPLPNQSDKEKWNYSNVHFVTCHAQFLQ